MSSLVEKIISSHAGRLVHANEAAIVNVDLLMAHDVTDRETTIQYLNEYIHGVR